MKPPNKFFRREPPKFFYKEIYKLTHKIYKTKIVSSEIR